MSDGAEKSSGEAQKESSSKPWRLAGLTVLMIFSETVYVLLLQLNAINGWRPVLTFWIEMAALFALYSLAILLVNRLVDGKATLLIIFVGAVLFRVTLLPAGIPFDYTASEKIDAIRSDISGTEVTYERFQLFDNDVWRYVWDGHVAAHGINPFLYAPTDARLDAVGGDIAEMEEVEDEDSIPAPVAVAKSVDLTDGREIWPDIRDDVNHADVTTIYPPFAQFVFRLSHAIAPGSIFVMKALLVFCELIGVLFLALTLRRLELPVTAVIFYAWNPLMIKVFAGSGHADAILVAALSATIYFIVSGWKTFGAAAFGLAILAKLSPILLIPFVVRRVGWQRSLLVAGVIFVGYLPFLDAGSNLFAGFLKFAREWQFNAGPFSVVRWFAALATNDSANLARQVCAALILAVAGYLTWRDDLSERTFVRSSAIVLGAAIILSPTVMPWYLSWVLPLAILARHYIWLYFSAIVLTAFHIMIDTTEYAVVLWIEYGLLAFILFCWLNWRHRNNLNAGLDSAVPASARFSFW